MRKIALQILSICTVVFFTTSCTEKQQTNVEQQDDSLGFMYENVEFDMPKVKETSFPDYAVSIADFGAVGDGLTSNTKAFSDAINNVSEKGGGKVSVPRGLWLTGPIQLKSNINLHLEDGALIRFSRNFEEYPLVETSFEGLNTTRCMSPIYAKDVENIAITGKGTIDGSGDAWRYIKKGKLTPSHWKKLVSSGGVLNDKEDIWFPSESSLAGFIASSNFNVPDLIDKSELSKVKDFLRPVMVSIVNSKRILLDGPTFQNSPAWNIHPLMSEDIIIRNLNVRNPWYSQNGDGLDLESCKNVLIYNNTFDVGDDAICFKSGKNEDGRKRAIPTENVVVKNNIVYHGHGGFVIGSEMSSGVKNVHISNCTFIGTDVGLRFKSTRGRGGVVENIYISNIDMVDIPTDVINFNLFYGGNSPILEADQSADDEKRDEVLVPVTEETPSFKNIFMKNIRATGSGVAANFQGLPEMNLQNVSLENSVLEAEKGIIAVDTDGLILKNVKVIPTKGNALTLYNSKNVQVDDFKFELKDDAKPVRILGNLTQNVKLKKTDFNNTDSQIEIGNDVSKTSVIIE
jgi:polygalacturonase